MCFRFFQNVCLFSLCSIIIGNSSLATEPSYVNNVLSQMENRIAWLEEQVRNLTGRAEELEHALKMSGKGMSPTQSSNNTSGVLKSENAIHGLSSAGQPQLNAAPAPATGMPGVPQIDPQMLTEAEKERLQAKEQPQPATSQVQHTLPTGSAQDDYERSLSLLNSGEYEEAEASFKSFIGRYPTDPLIVNAKYWLGETCLSRKNYGEAAVAFAEAYQTWKEFGKKAGAGKHGHTRAPEALIKLAFALKGLKKDDDACATLAQVKQEFPHLPHSLAKLAERARHGLRCRPN